MYLVVRGPESPSDIFVVEDHDFEGEVFFQVFNDHDQEGEFDAQSLLGVHGGGDVVGAHVGAHNFQYARLNVLISDALNMTIAN